MLHTPLAQASTLLAVIVVGFALARGRWPERAAALAIAVDWAGSIVLQNPHSSHGQPAVFVLDALQALVLLALVVRCARTWALWAAAFGVLLVLTHVTLVLDPRLGAWSYYTAVYLWSFGLLAALGVGAALEGRRPVRILGRSPTRPAGGRASA